MSNPPALGGPITGGTATRDQPCCWRSPGGMTGGGSILANVLVLIGVWAIGCHYGARTEKADSTASKYCGSFLSTTARARANLVRRSRTYSRSVNTSVNARSNSAYRSSPFCCVITRASFAAPDQSLSKCAHCPAILSNIVDVDAERRGDLLERLDRTFACSSLDLRNVSRRKTCRLGKPLDSQAAVLAPDP
jgi:hypothetical protein